MNEHDNKETVSVDVTIHTAFEELAQTIVNKYGLRVEDVQFKWETLAAYPNNHHDVTVTKITSSRWH